MSGESDFINRLRSLAAHPAARGLSDDAAAFAHGGRTLVLTHDVIVENVHFLPTDPMSSVGQKLVRVNVSDIHAKAAEPLEALLSIAWPGNRTEQAFAQFMSGVQMDLDTFGVSLIGGDLVLHDGPLTLTLTLTGRCIGKARFECVAQLADGFPETIV